MKKYISFFLISICTAVISASTPAFATVTDNTNTLLNHYFTTLPGFNDSGSSRPLSQNSTQEDANTAIIMPNEWDTEDTENSDTIDTSQSVGAIVEASENDTLSPYSGTMYDSGNSNTTVPSSLPLIFSKLNMQQWNDSVQSQLTELSNKISVLQTTQKALSQVRSMLTQIDSTLGDSSTVVLPSDIKTSLIKYGICPNNYPPLMKSEISREDLECLIQLTDMKLEQTGTEAQTLMVNLQNLMNQYSSYVDGTSQQTLTSISRGQTMLGDGNSVLFTSILLGAAAGVGGTLLTQRVVKKRKEQ